MKKLNKSEKIELVKSYRNISGTDLTNKLLSLLTDQQLKDLIADLDENGDPDDFYCAVHECNFQ